MPKFLEKTILSFLASLVLLFSFAPYFKANAAPNPPPPTPIPKIEATVNAGSASDSSTNWYNQSFDGWYNKVYDENNASEIFGERYTAAQVQWVVYSLMAFIINAPLGNSTDSQAAVRCFITNSGDLNSCLTALDKLVPKLNPSGLLPPQKQESLMSLLFTDRPLSGVTYIKQKINKFSLVPEAQAQTPGFGFSALEPVQNMWRGARDIAFGLFVLATIILAFMIMFRVKISPQVVISIQSAIPKLIIALVLVTFSYAIAGFLVDLMYVVIGMVSLFAPSLTVFKVEPAALFTFLTEWNILVILAGYMFFLVMSFIALIAMLIGAPAFVALGTTLLVVLWWLVLILIAVLVVVVILTTIKTVWALLKAFANILLTVIFGPLQIVAGVVVPNFGFGAWFKSLAASLSTFVVTGVLMLLSIVFLINGVMLGLKDFYGASSGVADLGTIIMHFFFGTAVSQAITGQGNSGWPPLLGAGDSLAGIGLVFLGASFVLFTLIPKATEIVQGFITGKPFAFGTAIGESVTSPFTTLIRGAVGISKVGRELNSEGGLFNPRPRPQG